MVGTAPRVGGEAAHFGPVHLRSKGRRQFVGDEHRRLPQLAQQVTRGGHILPEIHLQPAHHVGHVPLALAQVRVSDLVKDDAELVEYLLNRPLGIQKILAHEGLGSRHEHRVVEHQQLRIEQRRKLGPAPPTDAGTDVLQLLAGAEPALVKAAHLVCHALRRHTVAQHLRPLHEDDRTAADHAGGHADPLQALHGSSPNPDATNSASASTAACSSSPSAAIVTTVPRAAASRSRPMMLFPSISRP